MYTVLTSADYEAYREVDWLRGFDPGDLVVPIDDCLTVELGPVDPGTLELMKDKGFDQAPVRVPADPVGWRLVTTKLLEELAGAGKPLSEAEAVACSTDLLRVELPLQFMDLLSAMADRPAAILYYDRPAPEFGGVLAQTPQAQGDIFGLLTIADLNGHVTRKAAYDLILTLETGLARLLKKAFPEPWEWVQRLSEDAQVRMIGFWEVSRRRGLDSHPVAAATLSHLVQGTGKSERLLDHLGFKSKKEFDAATGRVVELRNAVMHPVRPLVLAQQDVRELHQAMSSAESLLPRVAEALAKVEREG